MIRHAPANRNARTGSRWANRAFVIQRLSFYAGQLGTLRHPPLEALRLPDEPPRRHTLRTSRSPSPSSAFPQDRHQFRWRRRRWPSLAPSLRFSSSSSGTEGLGFARVLRPLRSLARCRAYPLAAHDLRRSAGSRQESTPEGRACKPTPSPSRSLSGIRMCRAGVLFP